MVFQTCWWVIISFVINLFAIIPFGQSALPMANLGVITLLRAVPLAFDRVETAV
jgi:hypothetical protein